MRVRLMIVTLASLACAKEEPSSRQRSPPEVGPVQRRHVVVRQLFALADGHVGPDLGVVVAVHRVPAIAIVTRFGKHALVLNR